MTVQQGMDAERVREIAQQLLGSGERIDAMAATGRGQISILEGAWSGPDVEEFSREWSGAERAIGDAATRIRTFGELLTEQADAQERASDGSGTSQGGRGGASGARSSGEGAGAGTSDEGFDWGDLAALGPLGGGIAALATKGPRLLAALTNNAFKMYQGLMPEGRLASLLGASADEMDDLFRSTIPARLNGRLGGLLRTVGPTLGKVLGPLGVVTGGIDLVQGIREGDWLRATGGGLGMVSGGLATAAAFGVALGPVGIGIMAAAGIAAAGIAIYQNWDAISGALSDAGGAVVDGLQAAGGAIADGAEAVGGAIADGAEAVTDTVGSVLSDPVGAIGGLF